MTINLPLDPELAGLLQEFDKAVPDTAREFDRPRTLSSGQDLQREGRGIIGDAARRLYPIRFQSRFPFFDMTQEERVAEVEQARKL